MHTCIPTGYLEIHHYYPYSIQSMKKSLQFILATSLQLIFSVSPFSSLPAPALESHCPPAWWLMGGLPHPPALHQALAECCLGPHHTASKFQLLRFKHIYRITRFLFLSAINLMAHLHSKHSLNKHTSGCGCGVGVCVHKSAHMRMCTRQSTHESAHNYTQGWNILWKYASGQKMPSHHEDSSLKKRHPYNLPFCSRADCRTWSRNVAKADRYGISVSSSCKHTKVSNSYALL